METTKSFNIILPAELEKSSDGEWKVRGLASTASRDQQGEVILQNGLDLSPIDQKRGILNWDHQRGPENTVGVLDGYTKTAQGLYIEGRLFKNHSKAKAIHEIMSSLNKGDAGRMGLSVEGKILERGGKDGKVIKKCVISAVALTMNPVNQDSFADLVKSMTAADEMDFNAAEPSAETSVNEDVPVFTSKQVLQLLEKALQAGSGYAKLPAPELSGGDALSMEDLDKDPKAIEAKDEKSEEKQELKDKKPKKMSKEMYKSNMTVILDKIQGLYPAVPKDILWKALKDRLNKKFPSIT